MAEMLASFTSGNNGERSHERYPFTRIWINGRHVSIEAIVEGNEAPRSKFEDATFRFIGSWLSGEKQFEMTTSGSTGEPKTIALTRYQMITSARRTCKKLDLDPNIVALVCLDPAYIAGKMMLVRCLVQGYRIMAVDPVANPLIKIPVDKCVQFTAFVPYQIQSVLESKHPHLLNDLDKILIGGAPVSEALRAQLDRYQCECFETYGMTETASHIALRRVNTTNQQRYFETLPGIDISVDDRGCLVISADYLNDPVVTNDLVEIIDDSRFIWLGRWDSIINTGGFKVMPEKVERELETIFRKNGVNARFFIAALPDEKFSSKVVLVLEGVQISSDLIARSLADLRASMSPYEVPREIYYIDHFHATPTGKTDRIQTLAQATLLMLPK